MISSLKIQHVFTFAFPHVADIINHFALWDIHAGVQRLHTPTGFRDAVVILVLAR